MNKNRLVELSAKFFAMQAKLKFLYLQNNKLAVVDDKTRDG